MCKLDLLLHKLEVFIEHIPRAERQDACSAATINVTSLPMRIKQGGYRVSLVLRPLGHGNEATIAYTVFVYGHIQGVGVTAYRIYTTT